VRVLVGLAVFVGLLVYLIPSWAELTEQVDVAVGFLAVGLLGAAVSHVAVAARWKLLTEAMGGNRLPFVAYLHSLLLTRFVGQFAPSLAMDLVGRGVALRSAGSKRGVGHAMTLVVLERIFDLVVPAMLLAWAIAVRQMELDSFAAPLLLVVVVIFLLAATPGLEPLARIALAVYGRFKRDPVDTEVHVTRRVAFQVALLGVLRFAAVLVQFAGIGAGVGLLLSWSDWAAATPVAQLTALVGVTPGGLGIVEVGWWGGLAWVGVDRASIALYLLAQRTALIAFLGLLSLATWPVARSANRKALGEAA
jgi:hypothetical protein